ncbi:tRNA 4-thiouridine(8) synthase ThiI [Candidatus Woesearchaeota archaeon]|nr:tRNA 4-thiouridine(8) synthase ThiI [Candidatus Woesearchaeota archaeon]
MRKKKGLVLISSGIDSPVAASLLVNDYDLSFIHFRNTLRKDNINEEKVVKLLTHLAKKYDKTFDLYISPLIYLQEEYQKRCFRRLQCVFCKRSMFRIAQKIAKENDIDYLISGENLAQVASQTLENMKVIDLSVDIPILRPLLSYDKNETVKIAKEIGTYDLSIIKEGGCPFLPDNPLTRSTKEKLEFQEAKINIEELNDKIIKKTSKKKISS